MSLILQFPPVPSVGHILPYAIMNLIFDYYSNMYHDKWVPYINKKGLLKFKLNIHSSRFSNNIQKVIKNKLNCKPRYINLYIFADKQYLNFRNSKIITYYEDNYIKKICIDFNLLHANSDVCCPGGGVPGMNGCIYLNYGKIGLRERFVGGFYIQNKNRNNYDFDFACEKYDPSREIKDVYGDINSHNRIIVYTNDISYLNSFKMTNRDWIRDMREIEMYY